MSNWHEDETHRTSVVLPKDLWARVQEEAKRRQILPTQLIRTILREHLGAVEQDGATVRPTIALPASLWKRIEAEAKRRHLLPSQLIPNVLADVVGGKKGER